jgi:hypothetical protein
VLIVLDATVFCSDFQMTGNAWRIFMAGFRRVGLEPCVPESVKDEVINRYREELEKLAKKIEKLVHEASRVIGRNVPHGFPSKLTIQPLCSDHSSKLLMLTLDYDFEYLPYPKVSHKDLVLRALSRRRPFRENGVGYRDALLWSAILEYLGDHHRPLALVTANSTDFGDGEIHPDLLQDLEAMNLGSEYVRLFRTLEELNHAVILPTLKRLDSVREMVESGTGPFSLHKWIKEEMPILLWDEEGLGPLEPGHGRCRFSSINSIFSVNVDAVRQLAPDQVLLSATAGVEGITDVSADWEDYVKYEDVRKFFQSDDDGPFNWVSADVHVRVTAAFTLILNAESLSVLSYDLDWYETDFLQRVEINPHAKDD